MGSSGARWKLFELRIPDEKSYIPMEIDITFANEQIENADGNERKPEENAKKYRLIAFEPATVGSYWVCDVHESVSSTNPLSSLHFLRA